MNWVHELNRFTNLRIRTFGFTGGISCPHHNNAIDTTFVAGDLLVSEYSFLRKIKQSEYNNFQTIIIDFRHPRGFQGSRWPSVSDSKAYADFDNLATVPNELTCESWWETLVEAAAKTSLNRVCIENPGQGTFFTSLVNKSEMQRVELVALRAAFILGAEVFASPSSSVKKRILTWARRRTKESVESPKNKIKAVEDFLVDLVRPFYFEAKVGGQLELTSLSTGKGLDPEVRPCILSSTERFEYEKCCWAVRGALSVTIATIPEGSDSRRETLGAIADALLHLRRQCIHSELSSLFATKPMNSRLGDYCIPFWHVPLSSTENRILGRKITDSPSQTDSELASRILDGSAKLRGLVAILKNECDFVIEGGDALKLLLNTEEPGCETTGNDRKPSKLPKKVVILAALPEVQIIISVLLNCIGIAHELLLRPSRFFNPSQSDITLSLPEKQANASTLAWIECQQALARFNSHGATKSAITSNLVVASPDILAGDHGGISIDMADFVITVDEDWSGRDELVVRSLVAGLIQPNLRIKDNGCQLLRLVCAKTCEENFLSIAPERISCVMQSKLEANSYVWPWPVDSYGRFALDGTPADRFKLNHCWPWRERNEEIFSFPGVNLLRFRGQSLSDVLAVEGGLPPFLGSGSEMLFLPKVEDAEDAPTVWEKKAELGLVEEMMHAEENAHRLCREAGVRTSSPSSFHSNIMTRWDLSAVAIRVYVEHFRKSMVFKHLSAGPNQVTTFFAAESVVATPSHPSPAAALESKSNLPGPFQTRANVEPVEFASSLLFYNPDTNNELFSPMGSEPLTGTNERTLSSRVNSYVEAFRFFHGSRVPDGQQGSESAVYLPPLFPRLLQCSMQAEEDTRAIRATRSLNLKRFAGALDVPTAKRLKVENPLDTPDGKPDASGTSAAAQMPVPQVITGDEAPHSDAATVLLDLDEDFGLAGTGAIPLPKDAAGASSTDCVEVSWTSFDPDHLLLQSTLFQEATICDAEEVEARRIALPCGLMLGSVLLFVERRKPRQYVPIGGGVPLYRSPVCPPSMDAFWTVAPNAVLPGNSMLHDMHGAGSTSKKSKKKSPVSLNSAALSSSHPRGNTYSIAPVSVQMAKAREIYKNRILCFLSPRQKALGMTLFESPAYLTAAVRLRNRFNERTPRRNWALAPAQKIGAGVPLVLTKDGANLGSYGESDPTLWTSIVKRLKTTDSQTGDDAKELAETQRSSLHRSLCAPCRVDFGPFRGGFLPSPSGMTSIAPPRSRIGVSLPMGVKVPTVQPEQPHFAWSDDEDRALRDCAARYGMNWILAARHISGFDDVAVSNQSAIASDRPHNQRSARSCRDRWQALARMDPVLTKEVRRSEKVFCEITPIGDSGLPEALEGGSRYAAPMLAQSTLSSRADQKLVSAAGTSAALLFPSESNIGISKGNDTSNQTAVEDSKKLKVTSTSEVDAMGVDVAIKGWPTGTPKKTFQSLSSSMEKKHVIPVTIPGVPAGSQPSFVASHPSHLQSVQTSIAASWTNGRTEMWPLQLLDVTDKQRQQTTRTPASASPNHTASNAVRVSSSPTRAPSVSSKSSSVSQSHAPQAGNNGQPYRSSAPMTGHPPQPQIGAPYHHPHAPLPHHRHHPHVASAPRVPPAISPHHPHAHHHPHQQRMAPSPSSHNPRSHLTTVPPPQYAVHTPMVHSQQSHANVRAPAQASAARIGGRSSTNITGTTAGTTASGPSASINRMPAKPSPPTTTANAPVQASPKASSPS